ncbi:NAD-dependent epimerase/dehydratase family protein [Mucilaginibacter sp. SMC90]|uniref:NAD-dependent epimerase/dehydratase family protein n=1 Tax=Mucilaginibacter sp. SMC90 TaxID=2929803 RepID=UPI001FB21DDD|nr:NAD-dependent epimerase/dehydratase family protein [Mucilaginibacter sp. SMC90]UOE52175.1 NAD-dependent epimerase/dehydratase family protein [Mucilaginibacter sp. SMC90]
MKMIITGAAGFIGSNLTKELLKLDYEIVAIDNFSTGSADNLSPVKDHPKLTTITCNVQDHASWGDKAAEGDIIFHLAATVGVKKVFSNSHDTFTNNLDGMTAVLEVAHKKKCKVFFASTSEVYGQSKGVPFAETDPLSAYTTNEGRSAYVISKMANEVSCLNYHNLKGVPVIIARLFNVIGRGQRKEFGMVVPTFIDAALSGNPLTLYGDGLQTRGFCNVKDFLTAVIALIQEPKAWGDVYNIGQNITTTIEELAGYIIKVSNSKSELLYTKLPPERIGKIEIYSRQPNIEKIRALTGWSPIISWQTSVNEILTELHAKSHPVDSI